MAKYEKLSNSISVAEMMHMREVEGLSNQEIAERIGVTKKTVYRYIGAQPAGLRKKWTRKDKLPALPATEQALPEVPRKSFAQRLEESLGEPGGTLNKLKHDYVARREVEEFSKKLENFSPDPNVLPQRIRVPEDVQPCKLEDLARQGYERKMPENRKVNADGSSHVPELIAMFGSEAVITWLKVSLYDMGIPDCRPMNRQKMLEALKLMNAGGTNA